MVVKTKRRCEQTPLLFWVFSCHSCDRKTERLSGSKRSDPRGNEGSVGLWLTPAPWSPQTGGLNESLSWAPLLIRDPSFPRVRPDYRVKNNTAPRSRTRFFSPCVTQREKPKRNESEINQGWLVFIYVLLIRFIVSSGIYVVTVSWITMRKYQRCAAKLIHRNTVCLFVSWN